MATTKTIQATVKNRTDTAANWTQKNPVLAEGEIIVVQTNAGETRLKIGDGVKSFTQLPYTDEQIYNNVVTSVNGSTGDVTIDTPVQPDWNQNDETAKDYVKNRICYVKDPALIGGVKFVATSNVELTRTMVDEDRAFMGKLYALCFETAEGTGKNNLKIEVDACTYLSRIYFDRGNFYINGEISGGGYYNVGREWTLTIGAENANLVTGQSYEVTFISNIEDVVTIPVKYFSKEIYRQGNSPVDFGDGTNSTVQGYLTTASGNSSHAEGSSTTASSVGSHAEGSSTTASSVGSHAEGYLTTASGGYSHAEGYYTTASGVSSHAEGSNTTASGRDSHAEGSNTTASGGYSHVAGTYNIPDNTNYSYQVSSPNGMTASTSVTTYLCAPSYSIDLDKGEFILSPKSEAFVPTESAKNIYVLDSAEPDKLYFISGFQGKFVDKILYNGYSICLYKAGALQGGDQRRKYAEIIGNGESDTERSNAYTLDWNGNGWFSGDVYVSSNSGTNKDEGSKKLATEQWVEDKNYLTEHQDVSNLATKAEVEAVEGKVPTNVVQYTEQTLTDEQKKQARENIGAGEADNGLTKVDLYAPNPLKPAEPYSFSLYVKEGNILPYSDSASDNIKNAYQSLYFIVTLGITYNKESQHKSLAKGLAEAYTAGLITAPLIAYGEPYTTSGKIIRFYARDNFRQTSITFRVGSTMEYVYDAEADAFTTCEFTDSPIQPSTRDLSTTQPAVFQFNMSADPTTDMQVATKKYVDSSIPTIPTNVSSFENDAGYLTEHQSLADYAKKTDIPTVPDSIKNPNALTFTGAATGTYDGSEAVTINIPEGGSSSAMKKLTFTGAVTGEYDGSSDVSIAIPEDKFYELHMTDTSEEDTYTIENDFDEIIAACDAGKTITYNGWPLLLYYNGNAPTSCVFELFGSPYVYTYTLQKATKIATLSVSTVPCMSENRIISNTEGSVVQLASDGGFILDTIALVVNFTGSHGVLSCDKTIKQIKAAYDANRPIIAKYNNLPLQLLSCYDDGAKFCYIYPGGGSMRVGYDSSDKAWKLTILPAGEPQIIKAEYNDKKITCDTKISDIYSAYSFGCDVYLEVDDIGRLPLVKCTSTDAYFYGIADVDATTNRCAFIGIWCDELNNWYINVSIIPPNDGSSVSSSDYIINVTLGEEQSSVGGWVLGYSCTCDKTYAKVLAAYQGGAKVIAHVTRNKEITLSDGSKKTIPIINEAPLTRYIAAQNLLVFDYVHNATDLSVSSGGLTYTTGDSGDSMICYVATYQFAFGAADTSADSVQIPTTTKVQNMIDTSISSISANEYTIQVSNTAPATGTSNKVITFVVEGE